MSYDELTDLKQALMASRLISIALAMGVLVFTGVVFFVYTQASGEARESEGSLLMILTVAHLVFFHFALFFNPILFRLLFSKKQVAAVVADQAGNDQVLRLVALFMRAHIARLACMEGAALFGLVVCMLGAFSGELAAEPYYWVNLGTVPAFLFLVATTFPTAKKVNRLIQHRLSSKGSDQPNSFVGRNLP